MGFIGRNRNAEKIVEKIISEAVLVTRADGYSFDDKKEFENVIKVAWLGNGIL